MTPEVQEWVELADADYGAAERELASAIGRFQAVVCFHAQQCAEKLLKAALVARGVAFPKTHDLTELSLLLEACEPRWQVEAFDLKILTPGAVIYRYPGAMPTTEDARNAFGACGRVRRVLLQLLW